MRELSPSHLERSAVLMRSSLGGWSCTDSFGANFFLGCSPSAAAESTIVIDEAV